MTKSIMRWVGHVACMGDRRGKYKVLVGRPAGKRMLLRNMHRWKDNIKMNLPEVGWGSTDTTDLAQDTVRWWALVNAVTGLWVAINAQNF
jgi:hypothetical protein